MTRFPLVAAEVQLEDHRLEKAFERLKLPLNVALKLGTIETLKHYVGRGLGIAVISALCITEDDHARLEVIKGTGRIHRGYQNGFFR